MSLGKYHKTPDSVCLIRIANWNLLELKYGVFQVTIGKNVSFN